MTSITGFLSLQEQAEIVTDPQYAGYTIHRNVLGHVLDVSSEERKRILSIIGKDGWLAVERGILVAYWGTE